MFLILSLLNATIYAQSLEATLDWSNRTELSSAVSGVIAKVNIVTGQQVKKGDILTQLNQPYYISQYNKAKAAKDSEKEILAEAKRELERSLELYERTVLAEHELQMAKNNHKQAQASYEKAKADFVKAKIELGYSTIKAPFDAVIVKVLRKENETINARIEAPLMVVVAELGKMIAKASIPTTMLEDIKVGRTVNVEISGKIYKGKVSTIGLEFVKGTEQYPIEVELETGKTQLRAGMKANIEF